MLVPLALSYAQLVSAMPRSGGDYVYASRLIHPLIGAFVGMGFMLPVALHRRGSGGLIATLLLPQFLVTLGHATGTALVHQPPPARSPRVTGGSLLITAVLITIASAIVVRGGRAVGRAAWYLLVAGLIGIVCPGHQFADT